MTLVLRINPTKKKLSLKDSLLGAAKKKKPDNADCNIKARMGKTFLRIHQFLLIFYYFISQ